MFETVAGQISGCNLLGALRLPSPHLFLLRMVLYLPWIVGFLSLPIPLGAYCLNFLILICFGDFFDGSTTLILMAWMPGLISLTVFWDIALKAVSA